MHKKSKANLTDSTRALSRRSFMEQSVLRAGLFGAASLAPAPALGASQETSPANSAGINARALGAQADGKTDNTKALQAALDAAKTNGPVFFLPAGLYRVEGALVVPPGITLCGASGGVPHSE